MGSFCYIYNFCYAEQSREHGIDKCTPSVDIICAWWNGVIFSMNEETVVSLNFSPFIELSQGDGEVESSTLISFMFFVPSNCTLATKNRMQKQAFFFTPLQNDFNFVLVKQFVSWKRYNVLNKVKKQLSNSLQWSNLSSPKPLQVSVASKGPSQLFPQCWLKYF